VASKGIFSTRDRTSSRNFCAGGQVKVIARKINFAGRLASSRVAIRILLGVGSKTLHSGVRIVAGLAPSPLTNAGWVPQSFVKERERTPAGLSS
jgi:hypothetical protein